MKSLRSKLVLAIALLVILMLSVTGYVLIDRKTKELTSDIYQNALNFSKLTSPKIVELYQQYYTSNSFSYFVRDITSIFALNSDISNIALYSYSGELLYDSAAEKNLQYSGEPRKVSDPALLLRLQDIKNSVLKQNGDVVYLLTDQNTDKTVDKNEKSVASIQPGDRITSIVAPAGDTFRVVYTVSYNNLDLRIRDMMISVLVLLVVSALIGIFLATSLASRIIRPIRTLMQGALEIGKGNLDVSVSVKTNDELKLLADTFNKMTVDLKKSTEALVEQERIGKELEIARNIQMNFLPKVKAIEGLDLAAGVVPAQEVGGDCFDFITLNNKKFLFYIGDVTGHGVPSGLIVSMANSLVFAYSKMFDHPKDILVHTNGILQHKTAKDMFMTILMASWDPVTSLFTYTQAGHDPLFYYNAAEKKLIKGMKGGMALGLIPDVSKILKEVEIQMSSGDVVVMFTDGYPESFRGTSAKDREILGFERFGQIIEKAATLPGAQAIYDSIVEQVKAYTGSYPQFDDMTLIIVRKT